MSEHILKLQEDLIKKLDDLCLMHDQPDWHVAQYFCAVRRDVDLVFSQFESMQLEGEDQNAEEFTAARVEFVRVLDEIETKILEKMPKQLANSSQEYASLRLRIEHFVAAWEDVEDADEAYLELALEIIERTNQFEKQILGGTSTVFVRIDETALGCLVHFGEYYLSPQEIYALKKPSNLFFPELAKALSRSLLVPISRPFIVTNTHLIVQELFRTLSIRQNKQPNFFYIGKSLDQQRRFLAESSSPAFISCISPPWVNHIPNGQVVDGIDASRGLFDLLSTSFLSLDLKDHMRPVRLDSSLLSPRIDELVLENVQIEAFDQDALVACHKLGSLTIRAAFADDIEPDFEFLKSMKELYKLCLVLPDPPVDLSIFGHIKILELSGSSMLDSNKKLRKLTSAQFKQLVSQRPLELTLSHFDIESICVSARCQSLHLHHNRIGRINKKAFIHVEKLKMEHNEITEDVQVGMLSWSHRLEILDLRNSVVRNLSVASFQELVNLNKLDLQANSIEELPPGLFEKTYQLKTLDLSKNRIRAINKGVFGRMCFANAILILDENPIDWIEPGAFVNLEGLIKLSLEGCCLKTINKGTFKGLDRLESLNLASNCIETLDASEDCPFDENLKKLVSLNLSRNRLEKLDLNCFRHLTELSELNLKSCTIKELNQEAQIGLLANLQTLNLSDNELTSIDKRAFSQSIRLETLDLFGNKLESLEEGFFESFACLKNVNLGRNSLTLSIDHLTFASCQSRLETIVVSENGSIRGIESILETMPEFLTIECDFSSLSNSLCQKITGVERPSGPVPPNLSLEIHIESIVWAEGTRAQENYISKLSHRNGKIRALRRSQDGTASELCSLDLSWIGRNEYLIEIDFSGNLIEALDDPDLFTVFPKLESINLRGNKLRHVERGVFSKIELKTLDLSNNCLAEVGIGPFRGLTHLTRLDLSGNGIARLNLSRLLGACPILKELLLADNQLDDRSISGPWHRGITKRLKKLVLANNRLETVDFFGDLTGLNHLDLNRNRIQSIERNGVNLLARLVNLAHLDLSGNRIKRFNDDVLSRMARHLEHLDVSNNPPSSTTF